MNIEMGKKYQTRDGRAVRILCVDMKSFHSHVVGLVTGKDGTESPSYWDSDGADLVFHNNGRDDLIPVPTKHEGFVALKMCGGSIMVDPQRVLIHAEAINVEVPDDGYRRFVARVTWEDS